MNVCRLSVSIYCMMWMSYFSSLGSQSSPGRSSRAVCLTSSLSTNKLRRCSAWTMATRIHSISGGEEEERPEDSKKQQVCFPIYCCVNIATIFNCIHCCTKLQWSIVLSWWYWQPWIDIRFEICCFIIQVYVCVCVCVCVKSAEIHSCVKHVGPH